MTLIENILLKNNGDKMDIKIADFGLSALVRIGEDGYDPHDSTKRKKYSLCKEIWGTREYFAPELINEAYGPQVDIWSLGCLLFEILVGKMAFPYKGSESELFSRIKNCEYDVSSPEYRILSSEAKNILEGMLCVDPNKRLSATECLKHPWITNENFSDNHYAHLASAHSGLVDKVNQQRGEEKDRK